MSALPDKPSELLELAINDALEVEKMPGWELDMNAWLRFSTGTCTACLAGAVMLRRLGAAPGRGGFLPEFEITRGDERKMEALDSLRRGDMAMAGNLLCVKIPTSIHPRIPRYQNDRDGFFAALRQLVTDLREAGL